MSSEAHDQQLLSLSDLDLVYCALGSPREPSSCTVTLLSSGLIAKHCYLGHMEDEAQAMEVARQLGIRVPNVKRMVKANDDDGIIIMEWIHGTVLEDLWAQIGWVMTIRLAFQLRYAVHRLRSLTSLTAGSLFTGECRSFWLDDRYNLPAHSTPDAITCFIEFWNNFTPRRRKSPEPTKSKSDKKNYLPPLPTSLVFTHHDLAPRNLLVDKQGHLWLLDWEYSGWYPVYFEYASMQNFNVPRNWSWIAQLRWSVFSLISVGVYNCQKDVLQRIRVKFRRFPVGRMYEVLHNKAPTRYSVSL
jgi:Phosphotransferase enzyme family